MRKYELAQVAIWLVFVGVLFSRSVDGTSTGTGTGTGSAVGEFKSNALLPACQINRFGDVGDAARARAMVLIQQTFRHEYFNSPISHHFFVRMAPTALREEISRFVWTDDVLRQIRFHFPSSTMIIPDVYHEIYLMRPEFDFVDENKAHYDGILNLPGIRTLRSLTYLEGAPATLVASSSRRNFTTDAGSTIVLDFNRELHFAVLPCTTDENLTTTTTTAAPRVIVKAAIHAFGPNTRKSTIWLHILAHRLIFFGIKSVRSGFESSESRVLMALDNTMRSLNKIHMGCPVFLVGIPLVLILMAPFKYPRQLSPYIVYIVWVCVGDVTPSQRVALLSSAACLALAIAAASTTSRLGPKLILLHLAWFGISRYMENNAEMVRHILLAPIPPAIALDQL